METLRQSAERAGKLVERKLGDLPAPQEQGPKVYDCAMCRDRGVVERTDVNHGREHKATLPCPECTLRKRIALKVPEAYRAARIAHFAGTVGDAVMKWLAKPTTGLMLSGPCGTGKTYLAWALLMQWWARPAGGQFWRAEQLYRKMRDAYTLQLTEQSVLSDAFGVSLLVLDDICAGNLSDHERRVTLEILNERSDQGRPTVVTTNSNLEQISQWDDRIASRLSAYAWIPLSGADRRMK